MRRARKITVLVAALLVVWVLELAADFQVSGVWWTHGQAMEYGGFTFVVLAIYLFVFARE